MVATPHQGGGFINHGHEIMQRTAELRLALQGAGIPLRVIAGGETRIEPGFVQEDLLSDFRRAERLSYMNRGRYFLIDLAPDVYVPLDALVSELRFHGGTPILAHPERNDVIARNPSLLRPLADAGCLFQVTAGSVLGEFGSAARELSERLIRQRLIHLIASDAHHLSFRKPLLSEAIARVAQIAGQALADAISRTNPAAVLAGEPILALPALTPAS
jgi:protein-tyrosine phosphatase